MNNLHVKTGDTVILLTGKYEDKFDSKGDRKTGKVVEVSPKENKVIVEGINMIKKHVKPNRFNEVGSIQEKEAPIDASNVKLVENTKKAVKEAKAEKPAKEVKAAKTTKTTKKTEKKAS
jgi:large subunit ribosomal protein L24